jgi:integrase
MREERIKNGRDSHNDWLDDRERETLPTLRNGKFADHLKPMVIVSLNTGMRRHSLFSLEWKDINFSEEILTIRPENAKSGKEIFIPMNALLLETLKEWKTQTVPEGDNESGLVFPSPKSGKVFNNIRRSWEGVLRIAGIKNFRWHDLRHDFASQLVMKGVDLNTVRELLGHADLKMTLRYAHLAPKIKKAAVDLLL